MRNPKFKYLYAWDRMMMSTEGWSEMLQERAEREGAPLDCIYRDAEGRWHRVGDITAESTRERIARLVAAQEQRDELRR